MVLTFGVLVFGCLFWLVLGGLVEPLTCTSLVAIEPVGCDELEDTVAGAWVVTGVLGGCINDENSTDVFGAVDGVAWNKKFSKTLNYYVFFQRSN